MSASDADDLREAGWTVAVHNDYRQDGEPRTFWLVTHPSGRWLKGEGRSDAEALGQIRAVLAAEKQLAAELIAAYVDEESALADPVDDYYEPLSLEERFAGTNGLFPPYGYMLGWIRRWEATVRDARAAERARCTAILESAIVGRPWTPPQADALFAAVKAMRITDEPESWLQEFHDAGFDALWYAHPGGEKHNRFGERWHAGIWTGPDNDLICVRRCPTKDQAERFLSPGADTPEAAVWAALRHRKQCGEEADGG